MADGEVGHLREKVVIPDEADMPLFERVQATTDPKTFVPFAIPEGSKSKVLPFPTFGTGYHTYITGLTHNDKGFPATDKQPDHEKLQGRQSSHLGLGPRGICRLLRGVIALGFRFRGRFHGA